MTVIQESQETQTTLRDFGRWLLQSGGLPADKTEDLLTKSRALHCGSGETVFSAGDTLEELFFVNSGLVRYYYLTPEGKEYNKNFVSSGSVVTSLSSFLEANRHRSLPRLLRTLFLLQCRSNWQGIWRPMTSTGNGWSAVSSGPLPFKRSNGRHLSF